MSLSRYPPTITWGKTSQRQSAQPTHTTTNKETRPNRGQPGTGNCFVYSAIHPKRNTTDTTPLYDYNQLSKMKLSTT
ncbi:hypothetical protein ASPSYDRAFT_477704 [Aspergillus sydowii CBS 593.65]|uniref:Uncharacterized protein n=1 Tax=Aspergillus sydowii CBS 593.65 TaxID=1036612 RepID=A0A1L9T641_9EURO|nr:uncharacterized protein ASPSYDRAFT_1005420 [Aspergillus sydowii CBS 593.65]XP_040698683.1 uncharacterized protein ASPSYDRAFT_477704 [Aspergillus sydowii CBS 593.65]OJJ51855.1 hypothetical protein ASPSYDRAFT_1005420 [Aspergillus sydowii CBS 593.65]OJJ54877.1 hypothetical protein ASPSYDRAFT_477704 [Aspergillus sydowii CBS 593.65]